MRPRIWLLALTLLLLADTAEAALSRRVRNKLDETQAAYSAAVRWGSFEDGWQFIDPDYRREHPLTQLQLERYQQLQVTGYRDVGSSTMQDDSVVRDVDISVANRHTQTERTLRYRERWRWDEAGKRWWQTSGLPDFWDGQ